IGARATAQDMRLTFALAALLSAGCQLSSPEKPGWREDSRVKALGEEIIEFDSDLAHVHESANALHHRWQPVVAGHQRASVAFSEARESFSRASAEAGGAAKQLDLARERLREAETLFTVYREMVMVAAQIDAGNLDSYRRWRSASQPGAEGNLDC